MLRAKDIMTKKVITVSPETEILEAARILLQNHLNGLPVVDDENRLKGIICQSDLIYQQKKIPLPSFFTILDGTIPLRLPADVDAEMRKIAALKVSQAMTPDPISIEPETTLDEIATLMVKHKVHTLPVQDRGILVGVIGKEDVLRTIVSS
ncbi:MAG: CBS domain-containing protein [Syntrophales bacterium]